MSIIDVIRLAAHGPTHHVDDHAGKGNTAEIDHCQPDNVTRLVDHRQAYDAAYKLAYVEQTKRLHSICSSDGIRNDACRMNAALDLAIRSPHMAPESVVEVVLDYVPGGHQSAAENTPATNSKPQQLSASLLIWPTDRYQPSSESSRQVLADVLAKRNRDKDYRR